MRRAIWRLHSWMGLAAGLLLLVIGATGSLLVFRHEIDRLVHPALLRGAGGPAQAVDALWRDLERQLPDHEIVGWPLSSGEAVLAVPVVRRGESEWRLAYLDTATGELRGTRGWTATAANWLLRLHYQLFAGTIGKIVAGVAALLLCALGLSGLWLHREFWRGVIRLRWGASARIFFSDLHKAVGVSSVAFNLVLGATGAYWNLSYLPELWRGAEPDPIVEGNYRAPHLLPAGFLAKAEARFPGFTGDYLRPPSQPGEELLLWGFQSGDPRPFLGKSYLELRFDPRTGALKEAVDFREAGLWEKVETMMAPLHYGTFGGLPIKLLWALGGLTPGVLAASGAYLAWRRGRVGTSVGI